MRYYVVIMAVLAVFTTLFAMPGIATVALMVTFGLATPLVLSVSAFVYGLCFYPLFAVWHVGGLQRLVAAVISAGLVFALAELPARMGERQAKAAAIAITSTDVAARHVGARTLEIRRGAANPDHFFADADICGLECRSLLLGGRLSWVRVVMVKSDAKRTQSTTFFARALGNDCAVPGSAASGHGACVLIKPDNKFAAGVVVTVESGAARDLSGAVDTILYRWRGWSRVTATTSNAGRGPAYRHSWARLASPVSPLVLQPAFRGINSFGYEIRRETRVYDAISLASVMAAIGLPIPDVPEARKGKDEPKSWSDGISDEMTRQLVAVLDLPSAENFNQEQSAVISRWVAHARSITKWTPDLVELLKRITRDRRLRIPTNVDQIVARNPDVAKALLPDVLAVIREEGLGSDYTVARKVALGMGRLDEDLLEPYADEIIALLDRNQQTGDTLRRAVGRLGFNPLPYLKPFTADLDSHGYFPRIHGACWSSERWSARLIPPLRAALEADGNYEPWRIRDYREAILKTLAKLGDKDFVARELASGRYKDGERMWKDIDRELKRAHPFRSCSF